MGTIHNKIAVVLNDAEDKHREHTDSGEGEPCIVCAKKLWYDGGNRPAKEGEDDEITD